MTTDSTGFATLPRLLTPTLAPRPEPVAPAVQAPDAGTEPAVVAPVAATTAIPAQAPVAAPKGRHAQSRPGRSLGRTLRRAAARCVVFVMVVAAGAGPVLLVREAVGPAVLTDEGESIRLPRFDIAPPTYGTAQVEYSGTVGGEAAKFQLVANGDSTMLYYTSLDVSGPLAGMVAVVTPTATYALYGGESVWTLSADSVWSDWQAERTAGQVLTFNDYVPDELRRFVSVADTRSTVLDGREVERYELLVEAGDAASEEPVAYRDFPFYDGTTPAAGVLVRVVLFVDPAGVVWRMETWGDDAPQDRIAVTLQSFAPENFMPQLPLQYFDENTGVLVGG